MRRSSPRLRSPGARGTGSYTVGRAGSQVRHASLPEPGVAGQRQDRVTGNAPRASVIRRLSPGPGSPRHTHPRGSARAAGEAGSAGSAEARARRPGQPGTDVWRSRAGARPPARSRASRAYPDRAAPIQRGTMAATRASAPACRPVGSRRAAPDRRRGCAPARRKGSRSRPCVRPREPQATRRQARARWKRSPRSGAVCRAT